MCSNVWKHTVCTVLRYAVMYGCTVWCRAVLRSPVSGECWEAEGARGSNSACRVGGRWWIDVGFVHARMPATCTGGIRVQTMRLLFRCGERLGCLSRLFTADNQPFGLHLPLPCPAVQPPARFIEEEGDSGSSAIAAASFGSRQPASGKSLPKGGSSSAAGSRTGGRGAAGESDGGFVGLWMQLTLVGCLVMSAVGIVMSAIRMRQG